MTPDERLLQIVLELLRSPVGLRSTDKPEARLQVIESALEIYDGLYGLETLMPTKLLYTQPDGTPKQIVIADFAGGFSPTAANDLRLSTDETLQLNVQANVGALANNAYWQTAKFDFGENWAEEYASKLVVELVATPTAGNTISLWLAYSDFSTAGTGNAGNVTGVDGTYTGYSSNAADAIKQLGNPASVFTVTGNATTTKQVIEGWAVRPQARYASGVILNSAGSAFVNDTQFHIVLTPRPLEFQN